MPDTNEGQRPTGSEERISNLDLVRGVAVLGILLMNVVMYGLGVTPYFNIDANGGDDWWDRAVGVLGEVLVDQKFMALFSMLFGAGIVVFHERAIAKGARATLLSLWRNALLLVIGLVHAAFWDGDILTVYALSAPLLIFARRFSTRTLLVLGASTMMLSAVAAVVVQTTVDRAGSDLGEYWTFDGNFSDTVGMWLLVDGFSRAIGMMLIGVALYRSDVITGRQSTKFYRRMAAWGIGIGLPLATAGVLFVSANDFSADVAVIGSVPNTVGTVPGALGYLALITLWGRRGATVIGDRLQAAGRMALTNYLAQTALGLVVLQGIFDQGNFARSQLLVFVAGVWALELWWSAAWLARFRFGPVEWLWRCATYRQLQPLRRDPFE